MGQVDAANWKRLAQLGQMGTINLARGQVNARTTGRG